MSATPETSTTKNHAVRAGGFTLIELLAVMLILAILMTLVVGASKLIFTDVYVDETKNNMNIIMAAIVAYCESGGNYPTEDSGNKVWIGQLAGNAKSRALILNLPETVWNADTTENKTKFRDAWGNAIVYSSTGGLAGAPGLTSAGPDGDINTKQDNVRYNK